MSKGKYYFSKSLEKGLKILSLFNRDTPVLTQSRIAKALGLNTTSTYRYINTLAELGYLDKDAKTKEIRPSLLCLVFCNNLMTATDRLRLIKDAVDRVHKENNISIDVALVVDDTLKRLYHREAQETLTYKLPDNSDNCLHNTALGKAYLSCLSEDQMQTKIDELTLTARTENTITTKKRLLAELREIKRCGYAMAEEEYLPGLLAIGAPLTDPVSGKAVGAVSFDFSVLQHQKDDIESKYADQVIQTAGLLSKMLPIGGGDG